MSDCSLQRTILSESLISFYFDTWKVGKKVVLNITICMYDTEYGIHLYNIYNKSKWVLLKKDMHNYYITRHKFHEAHGSLLILHFTNIYRSVKYPSSGHRTYEKEADNDI